VEKTMPFSNRTIVFVVGAPKAGTFSIYEHFRGHLEVAVSKMKEPNFLVEAEFNAEDMRPVGSTAEYCAQFTPTAQQRVLLEASTSYLRCLQSPQLIARFVESADCAAVKIVIFLRDPMKRAFSNWLMDKNRGHQKLDFVAAFKEDRTRDQNQMPMLIQYEYYRASLYAAAIDRFKQGFGAENVLVRVMDQPDVAFESHLQAIEAFIGIKSVQKNAVRANAASKPRNRFIQRLYDNQKLRKINRLLLSDSSKEALRKLFFSPDMTRLQDVISAADLLCLKSAFSADRAELEASLGQSLRHWL